MKKKLERREDELSKAWNFDSFRNKIRKKKSRWSVWYLGDKGLTVCMKLLSDKAARQSWKYHSALQKPNFSLYLGSNAWFWCNKWCSNSKEQRERRPNQRKQTWNRCSFYFLHLLRGLTEKCYFIVKITGSVQEEKRAKRRVNEARIGGCFGALLLVQNV